MMLLLLSASTPRAPRICSEDQEGLRSYFIQIVEEEI